MEYEVEDTVLGVLLVDKRQLMLRGIANLRGPIGFGQVFLEIHKTWLNRFDLCVLDLLDEGTHLVAVCGNGGNLWFLNLLDIGVFALTLEHGDEVVGQMALCEADDIFLRKGRDTVDALHLVLPILAVDESILKHLRASAVALE